MRKSMTQILLPLLALLVISMPAQAQKKIKKGFVKYELTEVEGDNLPPQATMMKGSTMEVFFSGEQQKMVMGMMGGMMEIQMIKRNDEAEGVMLTNIMGRKIQVKQSKEDLAKRQKAAKMEFEKVDGQRKEVAGYKCEKGVLTTSTGDKIEVYFTNKIQPEHSYFKEMFPGLDGFPLEYRIKNNGIVMVYEAQKVSSDIEKTAFDVPEDYEKMSMEEFEKQMGNMQGLGM